MARGISSLLGGPDIRTTSRITHSSGTVPSHSSVQVQCLVILQVLCLVIRQVQCLVILQEQWNSAQSFFRYSS